MPPRRDRPTLRDIAARVGVSETAASFALNGKPGVSEETRRKVLAVVEELKWAPNHAAQSLSGGVGAMTVGLAVTRDAQSVGSEQFFMHLMSGMHTVLSARRYGLLYQVTESIDEELELYRRWSDEGRVDGVVLVDLRVSDPRPRAAAESGMPAIVAGGPDPAGAVPSVSIDDGAAMRTVMEHLAHAGHTRVAYVCGDPSLLHVHRRVDAFTRAGRELGLSAADVLQTDFSVAASVRATQRLITAPDRPSAVVYDNEVLAMAGLGEIRASDLRTPADIAVVTCEDSPMCGIVQPGLTALRRDTVGFGADVAEHLLRLIGGDRDEGAQEKVPELVVRDSSRGPVRMPEDDRSEDVLGL